MIIALDCSIQILGFVNRSLVYLQSWNFGSRRVKERSALVNTFSYIFALCRIHQENKYLN